MIEHSRFLDLIDVLVIATCMIRSFGASPCAMSVNMLRFLCSKLLLFDDRKLDCVIVTVLWLID